MAKWEAPKPELVARFDACLPSAPGIERRRMFGCPCAFVNGNMFTGLHEQRLIMRLGERERAAALREAGVGPFVALGRTMREYVAFERAIERTPEEITAWMRKALAFAQSLPPKVKDRRGRKPNHG